MKTHTKTRKTAYKQKIHNMNRRYIQYLIHQPHAFPKLFFRGVA